MNNADKEFLEIISDTSEYKGAYNIRKDGQAIERQITDNINNTRIIIYPIFCFFSYFLFL